MKTNKRNLVKLSKKIKLKREELEKNHLRTIKKLITKKRIEKICHTQGYTYRERMITPVVTILHMIGAGLSREKSFQSAWCNIGQVGRSDILSKARRRMPIKVWHGLDRWIGQKIEKEFGKETLWRGHRVIGIDGTGISMSDEQELEERYGKSNSKFGPSRFPIARMVFAFTLQTHITIAHQIDRYKISEQELLRRMYKQMNEGDLIIGDRHFAGANLYVEYQQYGLEFITRTHQRLKVGQLKKVKELNGPCYACHMKKGAKKNLLMYVICRTLRVERELIK